jgi:hypothetical protein
VEHTNSQHILNLQANIAGKRCQHPHLLRLHPRG